MLLRNWLVAIITTNCRKPDEGIRITVEPIIAMCSANFVCADLWEINMTGTKVEVM